MTKVKIVLLLYRKAPDNSIEERHNFRNFVHPKKKKGAPGMNANAELLNYVYQNSQMGVDTLQQLMEIAEDMTLKEFLEKQLADYEEFHKQARRMLNQSGYDEKGLNAFEKVKTYFMVNVQTMNDRSPSNIASMLINGSTMGIIDTVKKLHQYEHDAEKESVKLMKDLREFEEKSVEKLKEFL